MGDVDFEKINYVTKANLVIERVLERREVEYIRNGSGYEGNENVAEALLNATFLQETRMYLASTVIYQPVTEF